MTRMYLQLSHACAMRRMGENLRRTRCSCGSISALEEQRFDMREWGRPGKGENCREPRLLNPGERWGKFGCIVRAGTAYGVRLGI